MAAAIVKSWNSSIRSLSRRGQVEEALQRFHQMREEGVMADKYTYIFTLTVCANLPDLPSGKHIHVRIQQSVEEDTEVGNALLNMYGKCGKVDHAVLMFNIMWQHDLFSWSSIITVFAKQGFCTDALIYFGRMMEEGILPNRITFIGILSACAGKEALGEGKMLHARFETSEPKEDVILETALLSFYGKCCEIKDAQIVFEKMTSRDNVAWNAIIAASTNQKQGMMAALEFCRQMHAEGVTPDKVTFTSLIDACANYKSLVVGKQFHHYLVEKGFEQDIVLGTTLVNMYGGCGCLDDARRVFDKLPFHNLVSWNALIAAHARNDLGAEAMQLYISMQKKGFNADIITFISIFDSCFTLAEGRHLHACVVYQGLESDSVIGNALVNMYGKRNRVDDAQYCFQKLPSCNVITWTSMIATYAQEGKLREALQLFDKMREQKIHPDKITFICGLTACTSQMALAEGKQMHQYIIDSGTDIDADLGNALITMYAKCGNVRTSQTIFEEMPVRDTISWNAVVTGFAQHGMGKEAFFLFERLLNGGLTPSKITFLGIFTACSHAGLVEEGRCCFLATDDYKGLIVDVDHQECLADLLGRAGCFLEAEALVSVMPFQPTPLSFLVLLGACKHLSAVESGKCIANHVHEINPHDPAPYILLSNIYVDAGIDVNETSVLSNEKVVNGEDHNDQFVIALNDNALDLQMGIPSFAEEEKFYAEV
ncbi:hypothetical protein L7F22_046317 [Adiantum nelumboides]|nr:hypothetical protein [Adiantum nelumboides]